MKHLLKSSILLTAGTLAFASAGHAALTASWDFETGTGNMAIDQVSTTSTEAFPGTSTWSSDTPGSASSFSLNFDDSDGLITNRTGGNLNITGTGAKTFVTWFKTSATNRQGLLNYSPTLGKTEGAGLRLVIDGSDLRLEVSKGAAVHTNGSAFGDDAWHMVAAVIPDNTTVDEIDFYVDGAFFSRTGSGGTAVNTGATADQGGTIDFIIGNDQTGSTFNGLMDNVRVYDHALTSGELDTVYGSVPEPQTYALLAGALSLAIAFWRRRS